MTNLESTYVGNAHSNPVFHDRLIEPIPSHNRETLRNNPLRETIQILTKEYQNLVRNPMDNFTAQPDDKNICIWYFLLNGYNDTAYKGGLYLGVLIFPPNFPYGPPEIQMISPSGRFQTRVPLCLTLSSFHKESWNAAWSIDKIIIGFISFMNSSEGTSGSIGSTTAQKQEFARNSKKWLYNQCDIFKKIFIHEYDILDRIFKYGRADFLLDYVLNEPLQSPSIGQNATKRVADYLENFSQIEAILSDYSRTKKHETLSKYFSPKTTREGIRQLELFHSSYYQKRDMPEDDYFDNVVGDDEEEEEDIEFYSSDDD